MIFNKNVAMKWSIKNFIDKFKFVKADQFWINFGIGYPLNDRTYWKRIQKKI